MGTSGISGRARDEDEDDWAGGGRVEEADAAGAVGREEDEEDWAGGGCAEEIDAVGAARRVV
jgi:hypothetical protein